MKRPSARQPTQIDYTKVSDTALKDVHDHVASESRLCRHVERDRIFWTGKLAVVEREMKRRALM